MSTPDQARLNAGAGAEEASAKHETFPSIWFFIAADCLSFAIFFAVFMVARIDAPALFNQSARMLDARLGLLNTLILITSSWFVALVVAAARRGDIPAARKLLLGAITVASGFGLVKIVEYGTKISHGITPLTNDFFTYYFVLTGVHFLHYLIGMVVLAYLAGKAAGRSAIDGRTMTWIESGGIYWHMVDLLWVFLFPMLYLVGGR